MVTLLCHQNRTRIYANTLQSINCLYCGKKQKTFAQNSGQNIGEKTLFLGGLCGGSGGSPRL